MKIQTAISASREDAPPANQRPGTTAPSTSPRQARPSFDDLHARITRRAYELYVDRGSQDGGSLKDWLDAERDVLGRDFVA